MVISMSFFGLGTPKFGHPCDIALGLLLGPLPATNATLHLKFTSDPFHGNQLVLDRNCPPIHWESYRTDINGQHQVAIGCLPEEPLPGGLGTYDFVSVVGVSPARISRAGLYSLFGLIRLLLTGNGELLVVFREDACNGNSVAHNDPLRETSTARGANRGSVVRNKRSSRWSQAARLLQCAFQRMYRHDMARALKRQGLDHAEWVTLARDGAGCLSRIQPLESRSPWAGRPFNLRRHLRLKVAGEFAVRASASALQAPLIAQCLQSTQLAMHSLSCGVQSLMVTPKEKVVAIAALDDSRAVLRIPLSVAGRLASEQNARVLRHLGTLPQLSNLVPRLIHQGDADGIIFTAETFVDGTPLRHLQQGPQALQAVEALLHSINPRLNLQRRKIEGDAFEALIARPLAAILPLVRTQQDRDWLQQYLIDSFRGKEASFGISHGDLSVRNIYMKHSNVVGVIDWDEASLQGMPVLDAISHLFSLQSRRGNGLADTLGRLLTRRWPEQVELDFLARCYDYFGVDPEEHQSLVLLYWLQIVGNQAGYWYFAGNELTRNMIDEFVALIRRVSHCQ